MKCIRYIETLAWVLLVGFTGLEALLWLAHSMELIDTPRLWRVVSDCSGFTLVGPTAGATILGCEAQKPLGVIRPFWVRLLPAAWALTFACCLLYVLAICFYALWIGNHTTSFALTAFGAFALALSMLHPAFWKSAFSAAALAPGPLISFLLPLEATHLLPLKTEVLFLASLAYFSTVVALYAASLVFRRA